MKSVENNRDIFSDKRDKPKQIIKFIKKKLINIPGENCYKILPPSYSSVL